MKRIGIILLLVGLQVEVMSQGVPNVLQRYRHLPFFSPALAGANDFVDVNVGYGVQPLAGGQSINSTLLSGYYSTREHGHTRNNSIRGSGTETMDDFYSNRNQDVKLKLGFGTALYTEGIGAFSDTYNSNTFAVHVPVANHTYLTLGLAAGINISRVDLFELTIRDPGDPIYDRWANSNGNNTNLHIDAGIGVISNSYYAAIGVNNIANSRISGDELTFSNPTLLNLLGGYRFFHSHNFEAMAVTYVTMQSNVPARWNAGLRGRINEIAMVGVNITSTNNIFVQLGIDVTDMLNFGYTYTTSTGDAVITTSHELGIGLRFLNHGNYVPLW